MIVKLNVSFDICLTCATFIFMIYHHVCGQAFVEKKINFLDVLTVVSVSTERFSGENKREQDIKLHTKAFI